MIDAHNAASDTVGALIEELSRTAAIPPEAAFSLPPRCYSDEAFFGLELEKVFAGEWSYIGRAADLPQPGDYLTFDSPMASVMAVRQTDGSIITLSRVCRHRSALLGSTGGGQARLFVCPYHKWVYELDGALRGAPTMDQNPSFKRADCALPTFRTEVWEGFVFFTQNPEIEPVVARLAAVSDRAKAYNLAQLRTGFVIDETWQANWKVVFENSCETYHHMGVHNQTLEPYFPTLGVRCEPGGPAFNVHSAPAAEGFRLDGKPAEQALEARYAELLVIGIFPAMVLAFSGATVTCFSFTPVGVGKTQLRITWLVEPAYLNAEGAAAALAHDRRTLEAILGEDRLSCAEVQRGLMMADAVAGPLSPLERTLSEFGRYLAERLGS